MTKKNDILYFDTFSRFDNLIHGFSTRSFGSMRSVGHPESLKSFSQALGINPKNVVRMNQTHTKNVTWVLKKDAWTPDNIDGLLSSAPRTYVSVVTADCVPILLYDKEKKYVGAVHAGWRGVYQEILKEAVLKMVKEGSNPEDIIAGIGPCIRSCCYDVTREHAAMFAVKFSQWQDCIVSRNGKIFLDLPRLVRYQLYSLGIPDTNIEDGEICTADSLDLYSCRKEGKGFGEFMGVIGIRVNGLTG